VKAKTLNARCGGRHVAGVVCTNFMNKIKTLNECDLLARLCLRHLSLADVPGVHLPH
jgi:hypothetical protein